MPSAGPPPPPPGGVQVIGVFTVPGQPHRAVWAFEPPIDDPTESVAGFSIEGQPAIARQRDGEQTLILNHGPEAVIENGQAWSCAAGAGGVVAADGSGATLESGSGTVG